MGKGYEKLKASVMKDCIDGCNCFDENGCNVKNRSIGTYGNPEYRSCFHDYCNKFKWVVDRAKEYATVTGLDWNDILDVWEEKRDYWYMNYYQDSNQPHLDKGNVYIFENVNEALKAFGETGFRCTACGGISSNPYECDCGEKDKIGKKCDWKSYGFFGCMGKGAYVFLKDKMLGQTIFMPVGWENDDQKNKVRNKKVENERNRNA